MAGTILYAVDSDKAAAADYDLQLLTVVTELQNTAPDVPEHLVCEIACAGSQSGATYKGAAGHVLITWPSGGRMLTSTGHWKDLNHVETTEERVFEMASTQYGTTYAESLRAQYAVAGSAEAQSQVLQAASVQL